MKNCYKVMLLLVMSLFAMSASAWVIPDVAEYWICRDQGGSKLACFTAMF